MHVSAEVGCQIRLGYLPHSSQTCLPLGHCNQLVLVQLQIFGNYYHPQCSCNKVIFSQPSFILSMGGVCPSTCLEIPQADTTLGRHPLGRHPLGSHLPVRHPPGQISPADTPWKDTPPDGYCSARFASYWNAFLFRCMICVQSYIMLILYYHLGTLWDRRFKREQVSEGSGTCSIFESECWYHLHFKRSTTTHAKNWEINGWIGKNKNNYPFAR